MNILSRSRVVLAIGFLTLAGLFRTSVAQSDGGDLAEVRKLADTEKLESAATSWRSLYERAIYQSPSGTSLPFRILPPKRIQPGVRYPLVLFLHGAGERGDDNEAQLIHAADQFAREDRRDEYPAFVVFPQCPKNQRWVESDWGLKSGRGMIPEEPSVPMKLALEFVDVLVDREPIDKNRLYVTGLSMGGQGAWFAAAAKPKRFAAMLEVCGGSDPQWANRYAGVHLWAFHGQDDNVVPVSRGREMIMSLGEAGHYPELRYVEYPGVTHNSWTQTFARDDVFQWLFAKSKP